MQELMARLGYQFKNKLLLKQALTHPSMGTAQSDNQRLEFLGDAVLQYCMSIILFKKHEDLHEGGLTHLRSAMVCQAALDRVARSLNLGKYIILNKSQEQDGGRENPGILADAVEAILAAVCLDGGIDESMKLIKGIWPDEKELMNMAKDSKSALQELVQGKGIPTPVYETVDTQGPPHDRVFTVQVLISQKAVAMGTGKSKRQAEQAAAANALAILKA